MSKERDTFIFYRSFYDALSDLEEKDQLILYKSICDYSLNKNLPDLDNGIQKAIFKLIKPQIEANWKKFENGCKAKLKQNRSKKTATQKQPVSKVVTNEECIMSNVNDNDNDNVNVNEDKKSKPKKNKPKKEKEKIKILDCLEFTQEELDKLLVKYYRLEHLDAYLERLNNYKMSNGKKYKSDYHVMRGWVFDKFVEECPQVVNLQEARKKQDKTIAIQNERKVNTGTQPPKEVADYMSKMIKNGGFGL